MSDQIKILYLAGSGRSGSTMVQNILSQTPGVFSVGELRYVWERSFIKDKLCGCGVPFSQCPQWQAIVQNAFGSIDQVDAPELFRMTESFRLHHLPTTLVPGREQALKRELKPYIDTLDRFYRAIQQTTGCQWILDSSKNPAYGYVLQMLPGAEVRVLHFVRDARAVAYSWSKKKLFEPERGVPDYMARYRPSRSAAQWVARNLAAETILHHRAARYLRLRYEDFVAQPQATMHQILELIDLPTASLPFTGPHQLHLESNHSVFGNLSRFRTGQVDILVDEEWRTHLNPADLRKVTMIAGPLLIRYGYLRGQETGSRPAAGRAPGEGSETYVAKDVS